MAPRPWTGSWTGASDNSSAVSAISAMTRGIGAIRILTPCPMTLALAEPGGEGVLSVEDWAEIRRLYRAEGMPIKAIARVMGVSRNTVRAAIASDRPPKYERAAMGSIRSYLTSAANHGIPVLDAIRTAIECKPCFPRSMPLPNAPVNGHP